MPKLKYQKSLCSGANIYGHILVIVNTLHQGCAIKKRLL
ncbi:hypothetical protein E6C60_3033 [Paenibacillus algicola]|uniref:Uncharacterized protein n=1 Tax=Paenibacillus algicola TaxID=2565926 RepID=A0A4V1G478_9BACL|nr:hypothetical protein E6C60_3033 [Paenibacillus algicola]